MTTITATADFIIIGGGIAGVSVGARLAKDHSVILLEAEPALGYHSSGRSAAMLIENYGNPVSRELIGMSAPFFRESDEFGPVPLVKPRGDLTVAYTGEETRIASIVDEGKGMESLSPEEAMELVPALRPDRLIGAAFEPGASDIDVEALMQGFSRQLRDRGGRIELAAPVEGIKADGANNNGGWVISTPKGDFACGTIINAAGAWADRVAVMAGANPVGLQPKRRSATLIRLPDGMDASGWPMTSGIEDRWYCRPDTGRLMVSPADADPVDPHDAWPDDTVLATGIHHFEEAMAIEVTRIEHSWAGLRSFTPDDVMAVGFDPECEGFFWLAGQGGVGICTSPALSLIAAQLSTGQSPQGAGELIARLDPGRFGKA